MPSRLPSSRALSAGTAQHPLGCKSLRSSPQGAFPLLPPCRVRLTSCCRALWRLGRDSRALWVRVDLQWRGQAALLRWLLRRRPQLRHLCLELGESGCLPRDVLAVLAGGPLLSVDLSVVCSPGGCGQRACGLDLPLPSFCLNLPNLRELCISEVGAGAKCVWVAVLIRQGAS